MFPWSGCRDLPLPGMCGNWVDPWNVKRKGWNAQSRGERRRPEACVTAIPSLHKSILAAQRVFRDGLVPFARGDFGRRAEKGQPTGRHRTVGTELLVSCHGNMDANFPTQTFFLVI